MAHTDRQALRLSFRQKECSGMSTLIVVGTHSRSWSPLEVLPIDSAPHTDV